MYQGFMLISLMLHPFECSALAATPMMPRPKPVCMNVSLRYCRSKAGIPPSSRVSRLKSKLVAKIVPPTMAPP